MVTVLPMVRGVAGIVAFAAGLVAGAAPGAHAEDCAGASVSSFSSLARVVDAARAETGGQLLATWLLRPRESDRCRLVFRVDFLMEDGRVRSMNFDAATLDPVEIGDDRDWVEAGGSGSGGPGSGGPGSGGGSGSGRAGSDGEPDDDGDDNSGNSGPGSSSSGSGSGGDGGDGDGDDGGSSGSGGGGNSGSGGGDSGGDDSGGDDSGGGSGSGGGDD